MVPSGVCARVSRAITVLFVEDDADTRFAYQLVATEEGMIVETARNGDEGIALAGVLLPDVIVLDIGLSSLEGLDGFEVARRLRADPRTSTIPIVFLSGYDGAHVLAMIRASGCDGHLVKPSSVDALLGLITELAMSRRDPADGADAQVSIA
jgi:CheY-like chemotaxis protein